MAIAAALSYNLRAFLFQSEGRRRFGCPQRFE